ncbi:two-component system sensor histidine kinase SenX3 [Streptomyces sp. 846.5]|nr:ATP-binding protein [Streptomyces sp. 846.5]TDU04851.1 two-component system sensor histidine kinase SenX3 [Streptomyces sp. 846.5]
MDVTVAEAAASALAGLGVGLTAALSFRWSEKDKKKSAKRVEQHPEPELPPGVDTVLSVLRSCAVVLDDSDQVIKASSAAYALGLVRGGAIAVNEMLVMARLTRRDGEIRQADLDIPRGGGKQSGDALAVSVRVAPLGSRLVLVLVEDLTEARRIEAVRRDFVANVSHELKTPVGALSLLSEAVQDASDDPEAVRRFAGRMLIEATRLTSLVQEIIELSRVQDDDRLVDAEPVAVDELVAEAMDRCRHQAAAKQITMAAGGIAGLYLHGNRGQLAAALGNLVENAVNYSPVRTRVAIAARKVPGSRTDTVEISVTDQGTGISEKDRERIFERFYRVDPARSRATGGTGLGLSIVKHVAASHGGTVSVWSVEGQGSTFTLRLPTTTPAGTDAARSNAADADADVYAEAEIETETSTQHPLSAHHPAPEVQS